MSSENAPRQGDASTDTDATDKEFSCDYCGDEFSSQVTKRRHEKNFHAEELPHKCPDCGTAFHGRRGLISHHAQKHDGSLAGYNRECPLCGEKFTTSKRDVRYCSPECGWESQKNRENISCERCGDTFEVPKSISDKRRFCSIDCKSMWLSEKFSGPGSPKYEPDKHEIRECKYCESEFDVLITALDENRNDGTFCSRECLYQWQRECWVGENNPLYKGGDTYYGENWHRKRRKTLVRDQCRCQDCGATPVELSREPSVHHIIPIRKFDEPEKANTLDNLVTLCEPCHSKWEGLYLRPDTR